MGKFAARKNTTGWPALYRCYPACEASQLNSSEYGAFSRCWLCPVRLRCERKSHKATAVSITDVHHGADGNPHGNGTAA